MSDCLKLNADGTPVSLTPLSVISWEDAVHEVYNGKATVLKEYDEWIVRSQYHTMKVPSVIIMKKQVKWTKGLKYSKANVYLRDDFTCQLQLTNRCRQAKGHAKLIDLTIDHVLPKSHGGKTEWTNVCTSCRECNGKKSNDHTILPKRMPRKPDYYEILHKRKNLPIHVRDADWKFYIGWPEELVTVLPQPGSDGKKKKQE